MPKIWIADDDEAIRLVLEEGLKSAGLDINTFSDGESLIDALNKDKPDLIISDIKMPGMHGYDLLNHIKNNYEKLPVIIMTAFTDMQAFSLPIINDKLFTMEGIYFVSFGFCKTMVQSIFEIKYPACNTILFTSVRNKWLCAFSHFLLSLGKNVPISPSPEAPNNESQIA